VAPPRIARTFAAVNIGSFRVSAMIAGLSETGELVVLGSGHRAAQGIKRGYVTDMQAAIQEVGAVYVSAFTHDAFTPGLDFGTHAPEKHLRFAYTAGVERLAEAVDRIRRFLG